MLNNDVNPKTLSRIELLKLAHTLRVTDADVMTRAELRAAIERARAPESRPPVHSVSWLGKARRLIASVIERGLHLPEAATLIRGGLPVRPFPSGPPPVATVTLARIYAAQGHLVRAIGILDEVLVSDPDHDLARELREELQRTLDQRREQERRQLAANSPGATAAAASPAEEPEIDEAPPSEAQLAPSELLGAVPQLDGPQLAGIELEEPSADEITLAAAIPETRKLAAESAESTVAAQPPLPQAGEQAAAAELAEPEVATRRGSGAPAPLAESQPDSFEPEPEVTSVTAQPPSVSATSHAVTAEPLAVTAEPHAVTAEPLAAPHEPASANVSPPSVSAQPPSVSEQPPESRAADSLPLPSEVAAGPAAAVEPPRPAGLVLIETSEPGAYLYWELATPARNNATSNGVGPSNGNGAEPHWVCVVAFAPRGAGSERREYRFPVQRAAGAVRLEGLPKHAVVRAKLSRGEAPEAPPLVVAGSVRVGCTASGCDGGALKQAQLGFLPYPGANPAPLAARAATHLASAAPLYI